MAKSLFKDIPNVWHPTITDYNPDTGETFILIQNDKKELFRFTRINANADTIVSLIHSQFNIPVLDIMYDREIRNRMRMPLFRYMILDRTPAPF